MQLNMTHSKDKNVRGLKNVRSKMSFRLSVYNLQHVINKKIFFFESKVIFSSPCLHERFFYCFPALLVITPTITSHTSLKVAEHSFRARFCWCNLAREQGLQKTNIPSIERSFYLLNTRTICVIFLYNWTQCIDGFSLLLQRYVRKGNDAKNPAIFSFCLLPNPVKCNACAVARKIETDCFSRNVPISNDPVVRISRNLAK